jgi:hypothetical protein
VIEKHRALDYVWTALAVLFFLLAVFHTYLAATAVLEIKIPGYQAVLSAGLPAEAPQDSSEWLMQLNREIVTIVNGFIFSYNRSSRLSNLFAAGGYGVACVTCVFCLFLKKEETL